MAQSGGIEDVVGLVLLGGAAYVGWSIYQSYVAAQQAATAAATTATTAPPATAAATTATTAPPATPATPAPSSTPTIVIPANFSVTPDINGAYKGTVTYNGQPATLDVILANAGNTSGVVWNANGQDITSILGPANVTTLVNAYQAAVNQQTVTGNLSGLGQVRVPTAVIPRRVIQVPPVMLRQRAI